MGRYLRENKRTSIPGNHIAVAVSTCDVPRNDRRGESVHLLQRWAVLAWRMRNGRVGNAATMCGIDATTFWNWLDRHTDVRRPLWVWAHNAAFVLAALEMWQRFDEGDYSLSAPPGPQRTGAPTPRLRRRKRGALVTNDPPTVVCCYTRTSAKIVVIDVCNWLDMTIGDIAAALGVEAPPGVGEMSDDAAHEAHAVATTAVTAQAAQSVCRWVRASDVGNMRWTVSGQASQAWRHWGTQYPVVIGDDLAIKQREREAYYAARCEVVRQCSCVDWSAAGLTHAGSAPAKWPVIYAGPVARLDITGCYPAVMRQQRYPIQYVRTEYDMPVEHLRQWMRGGCAVACVKIASTEQAWPQHKDGALRFVSGRVRTVLCGADLDRALTSNVIVGVAWAQLYVAGQPFEEFVDRYWAGRQAAGAAGDVIGARLWKSLGVSLHGKLGQRRSRWELIPDVVAPQPWGTYPDRNPISMLPVVRRSVAWSVQELLSRGECEDSFPALAAYVSAYARELVAGYATIAGWRNVLYIDADCLHVTECGYQRLYTAGHVKPNVLGLLHIERRAHVAVYHAPRHYRMDDDIVKCGHSPRGYYDGQGVWKQTEFARLEAQLTAGKPIGAVSSTVSIAEPNNLIRGRVAPDGTVSPFIVSDW